jgi:hypothetical protein
MIGETEKALHTPVPGTPIHDDLVARMANLIQSSEHIGALKERQAILEQLTVELDKVKTADARQALGRLNEWIANR